MKSKSKILAFTFLRYIFLLAAGIFLYSALAERIMLFLTIHPVNFLLGIFYSSFVAGNLIIIENSAIELIPACIAVSAYILLILLNLATPMKPKTRFYSLVFLVFGFFLVNMLRIFVFSLLFLSKFTYFNIFHILFWYVLSILIVIGLWFLSVKLFNIKEIPAYSDIRMLLKAKRR